MRGRNALNQLAADREAFKPLKVARRGLRDNIATAVGLEATHPGITKLLRTLAVTGFAPIAMSDPLAQKLCSLEIAGSVAFEDKVTSLPLDVWERQKGGTYKAGLVPISQMGRLLILAEAEAASRRS